MATIGIVAENGYGKKSKIFLSEAVFLPEHYFSIASRLLQGNASTN